jgi:hypothetical protein
MHTPSGLWQVIKPTPAKPKKMRFFEKSAGQPLDGLITASLLG